LGSWAPLPDSAPGTDLSHRKQVCIFGIGIRISQMKGVGQTQLYYLFIHLFIFFSSLGIKFRASRTLGKSATSEQHS
jgi:hypothetical protein